MDILEKIFETSERFGYRNKRHVGLLSLLFDTITTLSNFLDHLKRSQRFCNSVPQGNCQNED